MADGDLTTLANVKAWLNITSTGSDVVLTRLISAASAFAQSWMQRTIVTGSYAESYNGTNSNSLLLRNYPIQSVSSLTIRGFAVQPSPDGVQAGYVYDERSLYLIGNVGFGPYLPSSYPGVFPKWPPLATQVQYSAGFDTTPLDVEQAVIELIGLKFKDRDHLGKNSENLGGLVTAYTVADMTPGVKTLLQNYKNLIPV